MQLTQGTDYAVRALVCLAFNPGESVEQIAGRTAVPRQSLAKVVQMLARAGFVLTARGRGGGLRLARPPEEIRLRGVVEAMEGPLRLVRCPRQEAVCLKSPDCAIYCLWTGLQERLATELEAVRIADLLATCELACADTAGGIPIQLRADTTGRAGASD